MFITCLVYSICTGLSIQYLFSLFDIIFVCYIVCFIVAIFDLLHDVEIVVYHLQFPGHHSYIRNSRCCKKLT